MLIAQLDVDAAEALVRLRAHAIATGQTASQVAWAIVERRLVLERRRPAPDRTRGTAMSDTRERDIIRAFVALSNELVDGYDVVDLLAGLTDDCARLLDIASAGLLLADARGVLHVMAASLRTHPPPGGVPAPARRGALPGLLPDGQPVIVPDLAAEEQTAGRSSSQAARAVGFASVHALPDAAARHGAGHARACSGTRRARLDDDDLELAQALAHVASVAIVNEKSAADRDTINAQLQHALTSRVVLEQAKGVIAQHRRPRHGGRLPACCAATPGTTGAGSASWRCGS